MQGSERTRGREDGGVRQGLARWMPGLRVLFFIAFAGLLALLCWRCRYGYASPDETFYLITPYRLLQGDRMLLDEWHLSQFSSFTMVPAVWLYLCLAGSTEGMLLAFRYIYTATWAGAALLLYFRTRRLQEGGAMCAALMLLCYAPFGIMALSYNSLGILYLVNSAIFLLCARRHQKIQFLISGLFFAGATLCCPFLAAVWLGYTLWLACRRIRRKRTMLAFSGADGFTAWRWFTAGLCVLAVLFLIALGAGSPPERLVRSLGYALQDEEHAGFSLIGKTGEYFRHLLNSNRLFLPMLAGVAVLAVLTRIRKSGLWLMLLCGAVMMYLRFSLREELYLNYLMLPLSFGGIYVTLVTRRKETRQVGALWLIPGLLYTFCLNCSSNMAYYAISSAATVSSLAGCLLMWMYCDELRAEGRPMIRWRYAKWLPYAAVLLCLAFQMRYEVSLRMNSVFQEQGLMQQVEKTEITLGPQRGILTSPENAAEYQRIDKETREMEGRKALFICDQNWMYLRGENRVAAFSGWLGSINGGWIQQVSDATLRRLALYYEDRPERRPEVIFVDRENAFLLEEDIPWMAGEAEALPEGDFLIHVRE